MANIQERRDKSGKLISYSIRVFRGRGADGKQLKPFTATFDVSPTWAEKSARKKAEAFAATFEKQCKEGTATDTRQTFASYCDYVIDLKSQRGVKHSTTVRYRELTTRIYPAIGHIKLKDLRVDHLNTLYTDLSKNGTRKGGEDSRRFRPCRFHRFRYGQGEARQPASGCRCCRGYGGSSWKKCLPLKLTTARCPQRQCRSITG